MKHIFISLVLAGGLFSASAQSDSVTTSTMPHRDSTPVTITQNSMRSDSTASMNNTMRNDSTGSMNNSMMKDTMNKMTNGSMNTRRPDSAGSMKDTMNNMSNGTMNSMQNDSTHNMNNRSNMNSDSSKSMTNSNMQNNVNSNSAANTMSPGTVANSQNIEGQKGYAALPVLESYVSEDVVSKIKSKYPSVYDITPVKHTTDQMIYVVRIGDNGTFKTEMVGEDGNTVQ